MPTTTTPSATRHTRRALCVALATVQLGVVWLAAAQPGAGPGVFDGVAAVIGGSGAGPDVDVILRSDVELRARILLSGERGRVVEEAIPGYWLALALEQMIGESLIAREAERVRIATPTLADQRAERMHIEQLAGGAQQLATLMALMRISQPELDQIVKRRALVAVFLTANLDRVTVITDAEIERAYEQWHSQQGGRSLDEVREVIRAQLAREAMQSTVAQWVTTLRARTTVHVIADYLGQGL